MSTRGGRARGGSRRALRVALAALTACSDGGGGTGGLPEYDPDATPSAAAPTQDATPQPADALPTLASGLPDGIRVERGEVAAEGAPARAAADAWMTYWTLRGEALSTLEPDLTGLGRVSRGDALNGVLTQVADLEAAGRRTVGEVTVRVTQVTVDGATATLHSCLENGTVDVDTEGEPVAPVVPLYSFEGTLAGTPGGGWVVDEIREAGLERCAG
ncbi:hypothetical protein [Thalassiella azotivora]